MKTKLKTLGGGTAETLLIFIAVMGALTTGICTPTEAGVVGVTAVLLVSLSRRKLKFKGFLKATADTTKTAAYIFMFIGGVMILGHFIMVTQIPAALATFATGLDVSRVVIMAGILVIYFFLGMFLEPLPTVLVTLPIFYPLAMSLGYDPIWYGVMMVCVCGIGGITPPVGIMVYVVGGVATDVTFMTIFRGVWPFVGAMCVAVVLLVAFPQIATFLPNVIMPVAGG